jgi:RimJ/RimL family protein N-acetyltransferase
MKTLRPVLAATAVACAGLTLTPVRASSTFRTMAPHTVPAEQLVPRSDEVIVGFRDEADDREMDQALRMAGGREARRSSFGKRFLLSLDAGFNTGEAIARLRTLPGVAYAEPNGRVHASQTRPGFLTPNDEFYRAQWNMRLVDAERTWGIQTGSSEVIVAVLDTGVAFEDFGPYRKAPDWGNTRFVAGFDFVNRDSHPNDDDFHGTHVASTIAEATNNREGVAGLAFGCAIMPVKVLDEEGNGSFFNVAEGVDFAVRGGAKVINLSLGGPDASATMRQAVDRAVQAGVTVVAAAGNDSRGTVTSRPRSTTSSRWARWTAGSSWRRTPTSAAPSTWWRPAGTAAATTTTTGCLTRCSSRCWTRTSSPSAATTCSTTSGCWAPAWPRRTWRRWRPCSTARGSPSPRPCRPPSSSRPRTWELRAVTIATDTASSVPARPCAVSGSHAERRAPHAHLAARLPDMPRLVETRGMLLSPGSQVRGDAEGGRYVVFEERLAAVVGVPDSVTLTAVLAEAAQVKDLLVMRDAFEVVRTILPSWHVEEAVIHCLPDPAPEWPLPERDVSFIDADTSLAHVAPELAAEVAAALATGPVAATWYDGRPVAFCYASSITETLWDVSIDTIPAYRRRGFAQSAVYLMAAFHRERARLPVWGAVIGNLASLQLASRMGFAPVDTLYVFSRPSR